MLRLLVLVLLSTSVMASTDFELLNEKINPFTGEQYSHISKSEIIQKRRGQIQYITLYNKESKKEYLDVPWVQEDCHDEADRFFNWAHEYSVERTYEGGLSLELLGVGISSGAQLSKNVSIGYERWIQAVKGVKAMHFLVKMSEELKGKIFKVKIDEDGNKTVINSRRYPKNFLLDNQNPGLIVERKILETCEL